mmetsp:Transcript_30166/g.76271  ORF Transcript_30166/g.76271 Transcript_30166/m.76271 type:complete len:364 (-) Transcript_30166:317-1408(-)|eukprot:CAMPEP_0115220284 /NCGR_PEP_ID=MMETSP0270-20121206/27367_1 /TAXON_ID=71861 /ORGANISM="Scrippsiella trochoidea, Strain CCMP3099" /LENGTH=363 /DNA_ID=CAMNT_0002634333 /DNA_START=38 /DNA_END=1129 /DNA_ORIENTATION=+
MASGDFDGFGLYEYGGQGKFELLGVPWQPQNAATAAQPESAGRPVLLYVHGWQPGVCQNLAPEGFITPTEVYGEARDVAQPWLDAGYRVLCFMWIPFADERDVATAEQKIWSSGPAQVQRRLTSDGTQQEVRDVGSMGEAFFEMYQQHVAGASRIHLVGHSLGSQMVARLLEHLLEEKNQHMLPQRVTLLDPYFTNFGKKYLDGRWTGERVREAVRQAAEAGAAIEQVVSSAVLKNPLSDSNDELRFHTAYYVLSPDFIKLAFGPRDVQVLTDRHSYARYAYFGSFSGPDCGSKAKAASEAGKQERIVGMADRTDAEVRQMMTSERHWVQVDGCDSWDPARLVFEPRAGSSTSVRPREMVQYA